MIATLWLAAGLACAELNPLMEPGPASLAHDTPASVEGGTPPRPAASRITDVTVYQGQALVTREVSVPEGEGTVELVVTPLPAQTVDGSLYTEGADGLRVLSTRFRTRGRQGGHAPGGPGQGGAAQEAPGRGPAAPEARSPSRRKTSSTSRSSRASPARPSPA